MARLEVCCFDLQSALLVAETPVDRIELCKDCDLGGTTPPIQWLRDIKSRCKIQVRVMIRPRGGDFIYSDDEFTIMLDDIARYRDHADGFVFGVLSSDGRVDVKRTHALVCQAHPRPCTFHRAIDETNDIEQALEDIIETGCDTILTSGGRSTAPEGKDVLQRLVEMANGRVAIMAGGGVRAENIHDLNRSVAAPWYHSSAKNPDHILPSTEQILFMKEALSSPANSTSR